MGREMRHWLLAFCAVVGCFTSVALAVPPNVHIDEISAGVNGDARLQFIEIKMQSPADNAWGPQPGESAGRLRLVFLDARGTQVGEYVFAADAPVGVIDPVNGGYSVLAATQSFASSPGMPSPDFILPQEVMAQDGQVRLTHNPANPNAPELNLCLSYGNFVGDTGIDTLGQPAGAPTAALPITDANSVRRSQNYGNFGTGQFNADFAVAPPAPRNSAGATGSVTIAPAVDQGRTLFTFETFNGNGRSCHSCHRSDTAFGLSPSKISFAKPTDPLFVAEFDPNLTALENSCLMRGSRGVHLENIDGFANPPVFRGSPSLWNVNFTAPFGHSAEFTSLQQFTTGAVEQHFPKTLARNADPNAGPLDFRLPTAAELSHMQTFMASIKLPADGNFNITRMTDAAVSRGADAAAIQRGRDLFFGTTGGAKCFLCHGMPVLASANPALGGGNQAFNTGVSELPINSTFADACLGGQPLPAEAGGTRTFSTPALIGVARTAPYFHNNAVRTLREAVAFYNGPEFNNSPAAQNPLIGTISLTAQDIDDITEFLTALDEPFIDCDEDTIDDRVQIVGGAPDCNQNGMLDECELAGNDCNGNGIPDECDLGLLSVAAAESHGTGAGGHFVTSADIDGDGDADLLVPDWTAFNFRVLLNNGNGSSFALSGGFAVPSYPRTLAVADFDGDMDLDVAVSNLLVSQVSVFLNNGVDGQDQWLGFTAAAPVNMNVGAGENGGSIYVLASDLNNDGRPDLAVAKIFMNQVAIALNQGPDGQGGWLGFASPIDVSAGGSSPWAIAAGRLDADTSNDLVVANRSTDNIAVLINNGSGMFAAPVTYAVGDSPESVAVAELSGDGLSDVAVANSDSDTLTVFNGNGGGELTMPRAVIVGSYPFGAQPHSVQPSDIDGDGDLDLIVSNKVSKNVSVVLNDGLADFSKLINIPVAVGPDFAALSDLNADGTVDIAAVHFSTATCSVIMNLTPSFGGDCNQNGEPDDCEISSGALGDLNDNDVPDICEHLGDLDADGVVGDLDLVLLVAVLLGEDTIPAHVAAADIDASGAANGLDINLFVTLFVAGY
jgi:cytochrome c peroxidase